MDNNMDNMLDMYLFETNTLIEQLDEILLNAEEAKSFTDDDINEIFRIMHTIKGSSAMMQFSTLMTIAHRIEDLFFFIRENGVNEDYRLQLFDLMFHSNDLLQEQVKKIENGEPLDDNIDDFLEKVNSFLETIKGKDEKNETDAHGTEKAPLSAGAATANSGSGTEAEDSALAKLQSAYSITIFFDEGCGMENLRAFMLLSAVAEIQPDFTYFPENVETDSTTSESIAEHGFVMNFTDKNNMEDVVAIIKTSLNIRTYEVTEHTSQPPEQAEIKTADSDARNQTKASDSPDTDHAAQAKPDAAAQESVKDAAPQPPKQAAAPRADSGPKKQSLISVNLAKLDKLMDIVGEIVITESMVTSSPEIQGIKLDNFTKSARQLRKLTDELQDIVMSIRMVPVSGVFQKMHRIVRDMSQDLGKNVKLTIIGADTEVDKTIVDSIGDPVMHMVRNSMDHGLESNVEERTAAGKDPQGEVTLMARHTGSEVIISISDDGKGVDTEKVLAKAKKNDLLTKPESEYTKKEILQMLLLPGFSTKEKVTEYSGRGVGMDVVKKNIEKVGGVVTISSEPGKGTNTTFKIPLTLAIVDGMEISVGKSIFTVPIMNIRQTFKVTEGDIIRDVDGSEMVRRMDNFYPIIRIHELFQIETEITDLTNGIMIWVEAGDKSYCLFVDELLGEQQVVVKPIPAYLNRYNIKNSGIAGCTILGDGNISIILEIASIYDAAIG